MRMGSLLKSDPKDRAIKTEGKKEFSTKTSLEFYLVSNRSTPLKMQPPHTLQIEVKVPPNSSKARIVRDSYKAIENLCS